MLVQIVYLFRSPYKKEFDAVTLQKGKVNWIHILSMHHSRSGFTHHHRDSIPFVIAAGAVGLAHIILIRPYVLTELNLLDIVCWFPLSVYLYACAMASRDRPLIPPSSSSGPQSYSYIVVSYGPVTELKKIPSFKHLAIYAHRRMFEYRSPSLLAQLLSDAASHTSGSIN